MRLSTIRDVDHHTSVKQKNGIIYRKAISAATKWVGVATAVASMSGCLMTSPYWNQEFSSHTDVVPLQAWTTNKNFAVKYECATAYHGGLYPPFGSVVWVQIDTVNPQQQSLKDSFGAKVYGAGIKRVLPASCWRLDPTYSTWYTSVRATQTTNSGVTTYKNFDKAGLECLGTEVGKATSWFAWLNKGCVKTYSGSSTSVPYVIFSATS